MKHIQLYEGFLSNIFKKKKKDTAVDFLLKKRKDYDFGQWGEKFMIDGEINYKAFKYDLYIGNEILETLDGIENFTELQKLYLRSNGLKNLKGIENLKKLKVLYCIDNDLENLHGIEKLTNLDSLSCNNNKLKNMDEIEGIYKNFIYFPGSMTCTGNPFEFPLPKKYIGIGMLNSTYDDKLLEKFKSYEYQKELLTNHPEKFEDLEPIGYAKGIKEEFKHLFVGKEWGFFDLEGGSK